MADRQKSLFSVGFQRGESRVKPFKYYSSKVLGIIHKHLLNVKYINHVRVLSALRCYFSACRLIWCLALLRWAWFKSKLYRNLRLPFFLRVFLFNAGTQEAIAMCLHAETKQAVNETLCDSSKRPPPMTRTCNTRLCPPRYKVMMKPCCGNEAVNMTSINTGFLWNCSDCGPVVLLWDEISLLLSLTRFWGWGLFSFSFFCLVHSFSALHISLIKWGTFSEITLFCVDICWS